MNKRKLATVMILCLIFSLIFAACTNGNNGTNEPANDTADQGESLNTENNEETPASNETVNLVFPESFPEEPKPVASDSYSYDDMSKKYDIEIMLAGSFNQSIPNDTIKKYLDEKYNVNLTLTNMSAADLNNTVTVRFASGDAPDLVVMTDKNIAISLFEQGQLVEVKEILPLLPQASQYVTEGYANWATVNGEMIGIPRYPIFQDNWGYFLRKDWLDELGMKMPTNENELFEYAKAVTLNDPDKNNEADTWFMGGTGSGNNFGMLTSFQAMFGHTSWNVVDGEINHPMLDGTTKSYLQFLKKLNDNNLLSPDWYTIGWEPFKAYSLNDQIGMVHYPGWNLINETYTAKKQDMSVIDIWEPIAPLVSNDGSGGKYPPGGTPGGLFVFSKKAAEDEGKIKRIAHILDKMIYPNEDYWAVSQGGGPEIYPEGSEVTFNDDGTNVFFIHKDKHPAYTQPELNSLPDWQSIGYTLLWQVYDDPVGKVGSKHNMYVNGLPRYENYDIFLTLDGATATKVTEFQNRNEIAFVLGRRSFDEWDTYVEEWKKAGGESLMKQASEQLIDN